jgi:plasmid maintenance system antidote protein VapI
MKTKTAKKTESLFEQEMKNKKFKESFEKGYKEFLLSELLISLLENDKVSIRELAKELNVSPTTIQKFKNGKEQVSLTTFLKLKDYFGLEVKILRGNKTLATI